MPAIGTTVAVIIRFSFAFLSAGSRGWHPLFSSYHNTGEHARRISLESQIAVGYLPDDGVDLILCRRYQRGSEDHLHSLHEVSFFNRCILN